MYSVICICHTSLLWNDCRLKFVSLSTQGRLPFYKLKLLKLSNPDLGKNTHSLKTTLGYLNYYLHKSLKL